MIRHGALLGELHLDRARVARLHRTTPQRRLGFALRRELECTLRRLAHMAVEHRLYHRLEAFRTTTLFWREATRLGFEACARDRGCHHGFLSGYQRMLLVRFSSSRACRLTTGVTRCVLLGCIDRENPYTGPPYMLRPDACRFLRLSTDQHYTSWCLGRSTSTRCSYAWDVLAPSHSITRRLVMGS
jgi:hypothetical protein